MFAVAPGGKAAIRLTPDDAGVKLPQELACLGVKRNDLLRGGIGVKHSVYNYGAGLKASRFPRVLAPRDLEFLDVLAIDLREPGVSHVGKRAAVDRPIDLLTGGVF